MLETLNTSKETVNQREAERTLAKLLILYDSRTGNTEKMAAAVAEGARSVADVEVTVKYYAGPEELAEASAILFGSPTYYHAMTAPIKQMLEEAAKASIQLKGKIGAAFGSYGWSGEAPKLILEILKNRFGVKTVEPELTALYTPNQTKLDECRKLGKRVAEEIST